MHMADALLAPAVAATMYVASGAAAGVSIKQLKKDTAAEKARWCMQFYFYLLSEPTQRMLPALGAFSVRADVAYPYGDSLLVRLDRAYETVRAPDPFAYAQHRQQLLAEATAALRGDEAAKNNFFQRLAIVIEG